MEIAEKSVPLALFRAVGTGCLGKIPLLIIVPFIGA